MDLKFSWERILDNILEKEGGYVYHPDDLGGATMYGITELTAKRHGFYDNIRTLPISKAKEIYTQEYWMSPRFDKVAEHSNMVAAELSDAGVNMGPSTSVRWLQRWLSGFSLKGRLYEPLVIDGVIGRNTLSALEIFLSHRGKDGEQILLASLRCSRGHRYLELAEARVANQSFLYGWMRQRIVNLN